MSTDGRSPTDVKTRETLLMVRFVAWRNVFSAELLRRLSLFGSTTAAALRFWDGNERLFHFPNEPPSPSSSSSINVKLTSPKPSRFPWPFFSTSFLDGEGGGGGSAMRRTVSVWPGIWANTASLGRRNPVLGIITSGRRGIDALLSCTCRVLVRRLMLIKDRPQDWSSQVHSYFLYKPKNMRSGQVSRQESEWEPLCSSRSPAYPLLSIYHRMTSGPPHCSLLNLHKTCPLSSNFILKSFFLMIWIHLGWIVRWGRPTPHGSLPEKVNWSKSHQGHIEMRKNLVTSWCELFFSF